MVNRDQQAAALFEKGLQAVERDRPAQTVRYLGRGLKINAGHYSLWYFYAKALGEIALYEDSEKAFRKAIRLSRGENQSTIRSAFAEMLENQGCSKTAEESHRRAVRAAPQKTGAWILWGAFLARRGRLDEAEACHRKAITLRTGPIDEALLNLGYILRAKGKYKQARRCFLRAIKLDPAYTLAKAALKDVAPLIKQRQGS